MGRLGRNRIVAEVTTSQNGAGAGDPKPGERYCAFCGEAAGVQGVAAERFGEPFCSERHAEEFVQAVRTARVQIAAASPGTTEIARVESSAEGASKPQSWKGLLKMGLCCGAPLVALAVLAGGGGAVLGAAGAALPFLALLACPLGMYFMMRSKSNTGDQGSSRETRGDR